MKSILTILFLSCISLNQAQSQVVSGTPLSEINVEYLRIQIYPATNRKKVKITLDFGQESQSLKEKIIHDSNGEEMMFNSMIETLNLMYGYGYEIAKNSLNSPSGSYLLRRKED